MGSTRAAAPGLWLSVAGAAALVLAAVLLVIGIDLLNAATYGGSGGSATSAHLMIGVGGAALLAGGALLATGRRRHSADLNRARSYGDRGEDPTIPTEDRPENPHDAHNRAPGIGYYG